MKFGKVLTYKDVDEAKRLEGKKVVASDNLYLIENEEFCREYATLYKLTLARKGLDPFTVSYDDKFQSSSDDDKFQFIREVLPDKLEYEPYDLSDPKVRDSMRGRWYRDEYGNEMPVRDFYVKNRGVWYVNGHSPKNFLEKCKWLDDGTPCGRMVDKEVEE